MSNQKIELPVVGMTCTNCAAAVERTLNKKVPGVTEAVVQRQGSDRIIVELPGLNEEEIDRVLGLSLGADDYVVKPFSPRELVERVDRMVAGSEFKRQVPPIAKIGPRTAGIDYLYPRRRPGSARKAAMGRPVRRLNWTTPSFTTPNGPLGPSTAIPTGCPACSSRRRRTNARPPSSPVAPRTYR